MSGWSCKPIWSQSVKKCLQIELLSIRKCLLKRTHSSFSKPLIQTAILRFLWNFWTLYLVPMVEEESLMRDMMDRPILRSAVASDVDIILTGDKDFLESGIDHPRMMNPSDFCSSVF